MAWWIWVVAGAALLAAEAVIATDFYLVFLGVSGIVLGLLGLFGVEFPAWLQFLLFSAVSLTLMVLYRRVWKPRLARPDVEMGQELVGEIGLARDAIAAGRRGRVDLRGAAWGAINDDESEIPGGGHCEVVGVDGLTLHVRPEKRP